MDFRELQSLVEVMEKGSISAAAASLGISQPAVSKHIAKLEKEMGVKIFARGQKCSNLTVEGEAMYKFARKTLAQLADIKRDFSDIADDVSGIVRISASSIPGCYVLPGLLVKFRSAYPNIEVEVRVASGYGYLGRETPALNLTTDARGATSFLLRPGNRPGKLRVLVRAKHPALAFAQPEAAVELMVYPGLVGSDAGALAPPTLSPTPQIQMMVGGFEVIEPGRKPSVSHATVTLDGAGVARLASAAARSCATRSSTPFPAPRSRHGRRRRRSSRST